MTLLGDAFLLRRPEAGEEVLALTWARTPELLRPGLLGGGSIHESESDNDESSEGLPGVLLAEPLALDEATFGCGLAGFGFLCSGCFSEAFFGAPTASLS